MLSVIYILIFFIILQYLYVPKNNGYYILDNLLDKSESNYILKKWDNKDYNYIKSYFLSNNNIKDEIKKVSLF